MATNATLKQVNLIDAWWVTVGGFIVTVAACWLAYSIGIVAILFALLLCSILIPLFIVRKYTIPGAIACVFVNPVIIILLNVALKTTVWGGFLPF
jgi:hypothetical protein